MFRKRHDRLRCRAQAHHDADVNITGRLMAFPRPRYDAKKDMIGRLPDGFIARSFHCNARLGVVASVINPKFIWHLRVLCERIIAN
jgi:hypothetical protein